MRGMEVKLKLVMESRAGGGVYKFARRSSWGL